MVPVQGFGRAEIHGYPVLHYAIPFEDLIEGCKYPPAVEHKILGDDLEPIDHRLLFKDVLVMRDPKPDADAVIGIAVEFVGRHSKKAKSESPLSPPDFVT